jgi:hypothetical protein
MGIRDLKEQFQKAGGKKSANENLHKKFDKQVGKSRDASLIDKEQGYKKMPAFKKKSKSSFTDKLAKTVKKDEEKTKSGGLSID